MKNKIKIGDQVYPLPSLPDISKLDRIPGTPPHVQYFLEDTGQKKHHRKATPDVIAEITNQENTTGAKPVACHLPASFFEWKKKRRSK